MQESSKSYPCPECAPTAPVDRIDIVDFHARVSHRELINSPKFVQHMHRRIADDAACMMLEKGFFRFVTRKADPTANYAGTITGTIGVISPTHVATIEQRQREHQEKIANEITTEAIAQIGNWGSHFGHSEILKRDARTLINDALRTVLARYPTEKK